MKTIFTIAIKRFLGVFGPSHTASVPREPVIAKEEVNVFELLKDHPEIKINPIEINLLRRRMERLKRMKDPAGIAAARKRLKKQWLKVERMVKQALEKNESVTKDIT